jgi:hypothetical protein
MGRQLSEGRCRVYLTGPAPDAKPLSNANQSTNDGTMLDQVDRLATQQTRIDIGVMDGHARIGLGQGMLDRAKLARAT